MMVQHLHPRYGTVGHLCRLLELASSSYRYQPAGRYDEAADERVLSGLVELAGKHPTYGYRRLGVLLRRLPGLQLVNDKRIRRLLKTAGIQAKKVRSRVNTTDSSHGFPRYPNLLRELQHIEHPNHVWACDITYIRLADGSFVYLAIVLDVFTRMIRGWALRSDMTHLLCLEALERALKRATPDIHHSDQGVQYATPNYTRVLVDNGIAISMSDKGAAWQNGYAERWMLTLKEEEVYLTEYQDLDDALDNLAPFIDSVYNKKRIHSALGNISPAKFEAEWNAKNK
jgi:putative transposase